MSMRNLCLSAVGAVLGLCGMGWSVAQEVPAPPRALLEYQMRNSQWEQQQEQLKREAEITRLRMDLMRAQQELRLLGNPDGDLPGVVAIFDGAGGRIALLGTPQGVQWPVREGEVLPSGHKVERIQSGSVVVTQGEGRRLQRTTLKPLPALGGAGDASAFGMPPGLPAAGMTPGGPMPTFVPPSGMPGRP